MDSKTNKETATMDRIITKYYRPDGTVGTEYLTVEFVERNRDAWEDEAMQLAAKFLGKGRLALRDLWRLRTLCSRLGVDPTDVFMATATY